MAQSTGYPEQGRSELMGRRFPTPIIGLVTDASRYETIAEITTEADGSLTQAAYREQCRERLRQADSGERYSSSYINRITTAYTEIGLTRRVTRDEETYIEPSPYADEFLANELTLDEYVWHSLKWSWVAMGKQPEGIEALDRILKTVDGADTPLTKQDIKLRLTDDYGYEYNDKGILGYPTILEVLGVLEKDGTTYTTGSAETVERYQRRFRNSDIFRTLESRLKREGATLEPPSRAAKRDMMKYYMYREAGGWSKRRQWSRTYRRDYLKPETRNGETGSELRRKESYREIKRHRKQLREQIRSQFASFADDSLSGLSGSVLERIASADSDREALRLRIAAESGVSRADLELLQDSQRLGYQFPAEFQLYEWQQEAADQWFDGETDRRPEHGIAQVVTGAGKTVMALEVLRRWLGADDDRVATVVVPTNVLMKQWLSELVSTLNIPVDEIGWAGGGHKDDFTDCRVLVTIVNSAVQEDYLETALAAVPEAEHLVIADECHRYTGDTFSNIFEYRRDATLGLSATAISRQETERTESDTLLLNELGPIYYELTYDEGIQRGLIPEFSISYIGFDLAPKERAEYDRLSRKVGDAVNDIHQQYGHRLPDLPGGFAQKLQIIRNESEGPTPAIADYFQYTSDRRSLVDGAAARQAITLRLLEQALDAGDKTIVFQERIAQLEQLIAPLEDRGVNPRTGELVEQETTYRTQLYEEFDGLREVDEAIERLFADPDYWPVMYHSGHSRQIWNDLAMEWFRQDDQADVMLSVKALIEGVDVPSADVGIVRVSSSSIRQRIQTLGRILRTGEGPSEQSTLYVLYARDTIDERIFAEYDWETELASANVTQLTWESAADGSFADGTIREATPEEYPPRPEPEVVPDPTELAIGDAYEGTQEPVRQVSVDSDGRLFDKVDGGRQYLTVEGLDEAIEFIHREKGGGTLTINRHNHVLTRLDEGAVFLGTVDAPDVFEPDTDVDESSGSLTDDISAEDLL